MNKHEIIIYGAITLAGAGAIGYSEWKRRQLNKAVNKLSTNMKVDVEDPYIRTIVDNAVEQKLDYKINKACDEAITSVKYDITKEVKKAVNNAYSDVKGDVKKELKKQVGEVNVESIRQEIINEAKVTAADKFKNDLDKVLEGYNEDLENVRKIYDGIAQTIQKSQKTNPTITLGV